MKLNSLIAQLLQFKKEHPDLTDVQVYLHPHTAARYLEFKPHFEPDDKVLLLSELEEA